MPQTVGQYLGVDKGPVTQSRPHSDAYAEGCERMGWVEFKRYCPACGRLPYFCECVHECVVNGEKRRYVIGHAKAALCPVDHMETRISREIHIVNLKRSLKPHLFEPDDCPIACESPQGCGHPKKLHRARGNRCGVGGCKCRRYYVGPPT